MDKQFILDLCKVTQEVNEVFVCESKSRIFGGIYDNKGCAAFLERHLDVAKVLRDKKITDLCRVKKVVMVTPRKGYTDVKGIYLAFENVLTPGFMCPPDYTKYIEYREAESLSETSESKEKNDKNGINAGIPSRSYLN